MNVFVVLMLIVGPPLAWMLFYGQSYQRGILWRIRLLSVVFALLFVLGQISDSLHRIFPSDEESPLSLLVFTLTSAMLMYILIAPTWDTNGAYVDNRQRCVALLLLVIMAVFDGLLVVSFRHSKDGPRPDLAFSFQFNKTQEAMSDIWIQLRRIRNEWIC